MQNERGLLSGGHRLADAINELLLHSPVDDIKVPSGAAVSEMAWQFKDQPFPTRIIDCNRDQFLKIIDSLASEISKIQKQNTDLQRQYERALREKEDSINGTKHTDQQYDSILERHK